MTVSPDHEFLSKKLLFDVLDHLKPKAESLDHLPAWFLRILALVCSS